MQTQEDKTSSSTLKRNPKIELSRADLLKLLSYLEGELQARDVVIAALKSERVKQLLVQGRFRPSALVEPLAALQRDGASVSESRLDEAHIRALADHQVASLDNLVLQNRKAQLRMARILKEAEERHRKVVQELEEEKCKHEHDTAQGDDITYGLEKERTRLKQELELERQNNAKLEKELNKSQELAEEERNKQKQIVLLLLADRKKVIMKYIEERKRSEDLAQILSEEKGRVDSMAEGLEEESKKALQMEAELEKHLAQFDMERQQLLAALSREEKRTRDFELEVEALRRKLTEVSQAPISSQASPPRGPGTLPGRLVGTNPPQTLAKPTSFQSPSSSGAMMSSVVSKVVQPTATVSSVPVCGPTTGIARCVSPGQSLRATAVPVSQIATALDPTAPQVLQVSPHVSLSASPGTKVFTTTQGGKVTYHVKTNSISAATPPPTANATGTMLPASGKKVLPAGRGAPPPVPPNKPVVPPKKPTDLELKPNKATKPASPPRKLQA